MYTYLGKKLHIGEVGLIFIRTLSTQAHILQLQVALSNYAFNHQSVALKESPTHHKWRYLYHINTESEGNYRETETETDRQAERERERERFESKLVHKKSSMRIRKK